MPEIGSRFNFGKPNGELGTVERANEEDAVVKWEMTVGLFHQPGSAALDRNKPGRCP
jgi:hypothetical protein